MQRILFIVFRMFFEVIYYVARFSYLGKEKHRDYEKMHYLMQKGCRKAVRLGRVTINVEGLENIPKEDGYIFYPNHQGMFDVLAFVSSTPRPFAFVIKKEAEKYPIVKQVIKGTNSLPMDRKDLRQSIKVINTVTEEVKKGRNFVIFAEGTRSRQGNHVLPMKGGSFKAATNAKCPIVPCALIDCFRPFDEKGIKKLSVTLKYLKPITYDESLSTITSCVW